MTKQLQFKMLMFMLASALIIHSNNVFAQFAGGSGTIDDPYQIANITQLQAMNTAIDKHFILIQNIDASITSTWNNGEGFEPIGLVSGPSTSFTGTFDGKGFVISKLYINRPSGSGVGLFGNAFTFNTNVVSIQNVGLDSVYVKGFTRVGALVGNKDLIVRNCYSTGIVEGAGENVGGLVGRNGFSEISNSYSSCTVNGAFNAGGLVGSGSNIRNSHATGNVIGTASVGGLIGGISSLAGVVYNCYATGNVTSTNNNIIGGLIGRMQNGAVDLCYASGTLNSTNAAGLVYMVNNGIIKRSYSTATIISTNNTTTMYLAGLVGENEASISDCYSLATINYPSNNSNANVSGFVGRNQNKGKILNCYSSAKIITNNAVTAAFANSNEKSGNNVDTGSIKHCYFNIDSTGNYPAVINDQGGVVVITGLTDLLMKKQSSFPLWNFDTTWNIIEDQTYPYLRSAVTPCVSTSSIDSVQTCNSYTWINGQTYTSSTDTPTFILQNVAGCDSIITLNLTIDTLNADVTKSNNVLSAVESEVGTSYQWINCDNNTPILNETNQTFTVTVTGNYAVILNKNSCIDTSECVNVVVVGVDSKKYKNITVYPNPAASEFNFILNNSSELKIIDALGSLVFNKSFEAGVQTISTNDLKNGIYFIWISDLDNTYVSKILISK